MTSSIVSFALGDRQVEVMARPLTTLQIALREHLGQTATKDGCRQGGCGSCTVLLDGEPVLSCLLPLEEVAGRRVDVVETITPPQGLHPIQQAFLDEFATQCGYCTPGMIMLTAGLLAHDPHPTRATIVEAMGGNICRCTGYAPIVRAIEAAAAVDEAGVTGTVVTSTGATAATAASAAPAIEEATR
jgi:aerobic carbon-monoxide dehydrogenase small subunit